MSEITPFSQRKVSLPRNIEKPIPGLNDTVLSDILGVFEDLAAGIVSGPVEGRCLMISSPEPGYGKSHLAGRVIEALDGRASLVYITPFQTEDSHWVSLAVRVFQELNVLENGISQFEHICRGTFARLLAILLERGLVPHPDPIKSARYLRIKPHEALAAGSPWREWLETHLPMLTGAFDVILREMGILLTPSNASWIQVLSHFEFPNQPQEVELAGNWIRGLSLEPEEARLLQLSSGAIPDPDPTNSDRNELSKSRLLALCELARFSRPFVFVFDQTEIYGDTPVLAARFGLVISELADRARNHLTLITANLDPWQKQIAPHWQRAYLDRLQKPFLQLEGLSIEQARYWMKQRITNTGANPTDPGADESWLDERFPGNSRMGARRFLELCDERWLKHTPKNKLKDIYRLLVQDFASNPGKLRYDPDTLLWIIGELADGAGDWEVSKIKDPKGYLRVAWKTDDACVSFGFEGGNNPRRWEAILKRVRTEVLDAESPTHCVIFRSSELAKIPPNTWKASRAILEAKQKYLRIWELSPSGIARLYAARKLYAEALQGDIEQPRERVLMFLRKRLELFWEQAFDPPSAVPPPAPLNGDAADASSEA